jgi:hypothetical protein
MWPWIKRWRDWAMHDLWPMHRLGNRPQALHVSYEKAGLTVHDQPIPWNAEAVLVEAVLRIPANRRKNDFQLMLPDQVPVVAENLRREENDERHRLYFRFSPPRQSTTAEIVYRGNPLGQVALPMINREEFVRNLRVQMPTLFVRLGGQSVACQTFVSTQCKGLMASAVVASPTSLAPLLDLGLQVEFRSERTGAVLAVPAPLTSSQLAGRQALISLAPRKFPRRIGSWVVTWKVGETVLVTQRLRAISQGHFQKSLRVADTRFVVQSLKEGVRLRRQVPPLEAGDRVGPCFLVCSREAGMAGLTNLRAHVQVPGAAQPPVLAEDAFLITDGPAIFAPGTLEANDINQVSGFELRVKDRVLGMLSMCPAPAATFSSEGSFKAADEFIWTAAAEEELNDRLNRLIEGGPAGPQA